MSDLNDEVAIERVRVDGEMFLLDMKMDGIRLEMITMFHSISAVLHTQSTAIMALFHQPEADQIAAIQKQWESLQSMKSTLDDLASR